MIQLDIPSRSRTKKSDSTPSVVKNPIPPKKSPTPEPWDVHVKAVLHFNFSDRFSGHPAIYFQLKIMQQLQLLLLAHQSMLGKVKLMRNIYGA